MTVVETSISVNKPVEEVFAFLSDPNNQTSLNGTLTEVVVDGPVAVGTKFKLKGSVRIVEAGAIKDDGKVIKDLRKWD